MRYGTGVALVVLAGVIWSLQGLIFRQIDTAGTWAVLFWRSVGMLPVVTVLVLWHAQGQGLRALRGAGPGGVFGAIGLVMAYAGAIFSIQSTTIANAVFLFAASPFLAALLGRIVLGEKVRVETWAAIAIALCGIFVMVREGLDGGALAGNIAALLSALGFAIFAVSLRWKQQADTTPTVLIGAVFSILVGGFVAHQLAQPLVQVPLSDIGWAMAMGAGTLTGGMVLYGIGSRVVPAAELTLLSNIEVMLAPLWVWLFLGESASGQTFLGGAILLIAVIFNGLSGARRYAVARAAG